MYPTSTNTSAKALKGILDTLKEMMKGHRHSTAVAGLPRLQTFPQFPSDLPSILYKMAYPDESDPPVGHSPKGYNETNNKKFLRTNSKELRESRAEPAVTSPSPSNSVEVLLAQLLVAQEHNRPPAAASPPGHHTGQPSPPGAVVPWGGHATAAVATAGTPGGGGLVKHEHGPVKHELRCCSTALPAVTGYKRGS